MEVAIVEASFMFGIPGYARYCIFGARARIGLPLRAWIWDINVEFGPEGYRKRGPSKYDEVVSDDEGEDDDDLSSNGSQQSRTFGDPFANFSAQDIEAMMAGTYSETAPSA